MDLARNLIGINVGDGLTRPPPQARPARGGGRRPPLDLRRLQRLRQPARARPGRPGIRARRRARSGLRQQRRLPRRLLTRAPSSAWSACLSTWAGGRTRWPTCSAIRKPAASSVASQLVTAMQDAVAKVPEVTDVIVAPRHLPDPEGPRPQSGAGFLATVRARASDLYTSGTRNSFPKGVVGSHEAIYLESMSGALDSGLALADPVRRDDADVPHRAAQRVLHARGHWSAPPIYVSLRGFDPPPCST